MIRRPASIWPIVALAFVAYNLIVVVRDILQGSQWLALDVGLLVLWTGLAVWGWDDR